MRVETDSLNKRFGGVVALDDVTLDFPAGSVTAIIGPNGAGKTTLFNVIAGFLKPDSGSVFLVPNGEGDAENKKTNILGLPPHQITLRGVGVLFQDIRIFEKLTALENVAVGAKNQPGENPLNCFFRPSRVALREKDVLEKARHCLDYVGLADKAHLWAEQLSYGQQKLMAIARLLSGDAKVLLLDEPTSGVHPDMIEKCVGHFGVAASDALYVGDAESDWLAASAAGVHFIAVGEHDWAPRWVRRLSEIPAAVRAAVRECGDQDSA